MEKKLSAERAAMIYAMEKIIRSFNDETAMDLWLSNGVPDGKIDGDTVDATDTEILKMCNYYGELDFYADDENYGDLMDTFLASILDALSRKNPTIDFDYIDRKSILYSDGVVSY